jgi:hypothetical protein
MRNVTPIETTAPIIAVQNRYINQTGATGLVCRIPNCLKIDFLPKSARMIVTAIQRMMAKFA